jgi:Domain of unknown function (DUF4279)
MDIYKDREGNLYEELPNVGLYFRFYGDSFDPNEITRRLGVEPTNKFRSGDPIDKEGRARWPGYGWIIKVGPRRTLDIEGMLLDLRKQVDVAPDVVRRVCTDLNLELIITCGVNAEGADTAPVMYFPSEFLAWVVELGASLNVEVGV